ncbi:hypothetical protein SH528x_003875 [Novipirellula sp. SH528]|uniref:hypothetical protein n=1 Tax=Novipirellula sp. SH528 TaxID=3454466 RepID=UPI003F9F300B
MAWLQTDPSGNIHLSFRFGGKKFKRSLKTQEQSKAEGRLQRLIENIRLVESGRLEVPENADVATFLLSDGRLDGKPKVVRSVNLGELFQTFFDQMPDDSLEVNTEKGMKIHQRHLERHLGPRFRVQQLIREDLQRYVNKRAREPGIRGRTLSPTTIRKELATLRSVWNWALGALADYASNDTINFFALIECRRNEKNDVLIIAVEPEVPQHPIHDIRHSETIVVEFDHEDRREPRVTAARRSFPRVIHTNVGLAQWPVDLCLFERPYDEQKMNWTL